MIKITKERIDEIAKKSVSVTEFIVNMHKEVIIDFDLYKKLNGYVNVSKPTWKYLCNHAIEIGKKNMKDNGGFMWMNYGFSTNDNVKDWEADISEAIKGAEHGDA